MQFFDLVMMEDDSIDAVAKRLGYKRIYTVGKEIELIDDLKSRKPSKKIIMSDNLDVLTNALRQNDVIGVLPKNSSISKKILETIKKDDKILFIPVSKVTCSEEGLRMQKLVQTRNLVRNALMAKVRICLVSLAEDRSYMMSKMQMLEAANFLGIGYEDAKEALSLLGGLL